MLAFAWLTPLIARSIAGVSGIPVGLVGVLALYAVILRRAWLELGYSSRVERVRHSSRLAPLDCTSWLRHKTSVAVSEVRIILAASGGL